MQRADVRAIGPYSASALHLAALEAPAAVADILLDAGINVNIENDQHELPIHYAASSGNDDFMNILVMRGSKFSANKSGDTPEFVAIESSRNFTAKRIRHYMKGGSGTFPSEPIVHLRWNAASGGLNEWLTLDYWGAP